MSYLILTKILLFDEIVENTAKSGYIPGFAGLWSSSNRIDQMMTGQVIALESQQVTCLAEDKTRSKMTIILRGSRNPANIVQEVRDDDHQEGVMKPRLMDGQESRWPSGSQNYKFDELANLRTCELAEKTNFTNLDTHLSWAGIIRIGKSSCISARDRFRKPNEQF